MGRMWRNWMELAEEELRQSREALTVGVYLSVVFSAHQIAEHALKAVHIERSGGLPPRTHELIELAESVEAPPTVVRTCQTLNPLYMTSRYPDAANGNPARVYSAESAAELLDLAEEVLNWCSGQLAS